MGSRKNERERLIKEISQHPMRSRYGDLRVRECTATSLEKLPTRTLRIFASGLNTIKPPQQPKLNGRSKSARSAKPSVPQPAPA